ncbi:PGAP1-like protein [Necator americanus]|uniref:GPI inositol-deacylase n=1 Tax=Necator americanus TaxID=51031 RepID=W2SHS7_NECAM|nr:PGAP1-like protein [Necator americanus]ETN69155.1 PGAP1-like protein [Necator americanus]
MVHVDLHKENTCHMTYMWRYISLVPINVDGNVVPSYGLYRYMEGFVNVKTMAISRDHIPVLFVPGSGGTAKQVRSIASVMMNKTEMTSAPFRMHFYAVDFNEELSFLSGSILNRQRNFVVKAISTIQKLYSRKIVLIGHSLGGTVIYALPAHPRYDISKMGLVIILASPISAPRKFSIARSKQSIIEMLNKFQNRQAVHRPSWSIRGVDTPVDHLCILWCNQLTRHSTRILYNYGMEELSKSHPRSASAVIKDFFQEESRLNMSNVDSLADVGKIGIFDYPWVSRMYRGTMKNSKKFFELEFTSPYMVYSVSLASTCDMTMLFVYSNSWARSGASEGSSKTMKVDLPYGLNTSAGHIVLEGKAGCEFDMTVRPDVFYACYLLLISNVNMLLHFTFSVLVTFTVMEKLLGSKWICPLSRDGYYVNGVIVLLLFFSFTYTVWILECVLAVSIFYSLSCAYFVASVVRYVRDKIYSSISLCQKLNETVLKLIIVVLLPINTHIANSSIALLIALNKSSGPFCILLSITTGSIAAALGLAGPVRDRTVHITRNLMDISSSNMGSGLHVLWSNLGSSQVFTRLTFFFILSRAATFVRLPQYLVSLKDFFLALLLVVPGFMASQTNLSLETCAIIASFLLYLVSLL